MAGFKKIVVTIAVLLLVGVTVYPPWVQTYQKSGISQVTNSRGYAPIFDPPYRTDYSAEYGVKLDTERYLYQVFGIIVLFGGAYLILPVKKDSD